VKKPGFFMSVVLLVIMAPSPGNTTSTGGQTLAQSAPPLRLTHRLIRISQLDCSQYASPSACTTWARSACSAATMTEIANYYAGLGQYRITAIVQVEARIGEITPDEGLLHDSGIGRTMAHFGFTTSWGYSRTRDQLLQLANEGAPVIVSFPPWLYAGGRLIVVTGGTGDEVLLADSSIWNCHSLSRQQFQHWWAGFSAVVTPQGRQV